MWKTRALRGWRDEAGSAAGVLGRAAARRGRGAGARRRGVGVRRGLHRRGVGVRRVHAGGLVVLGMGVSGPQVVEGWYGQPFAKPLARTREVVDIIRQVLAREAPVTND